MSQYRAPKNCDTRGLVDIFANSCKEAQLWPTSQKQRVKSTLIIGVENVEKKDADAMMKSSSR
jgi:hypothetical protein